MTYLTKYLLLTFLGSIFTSLAWSQTPHHSTLPNGLEVWVFPQPQAEGVWCSISVRVGGQHDPPGMEGMAHFLEHMLFKGTTSIGTYNYPHEAEHLSRIDSLYHRFSMATSKEKAALFDAIKKESELADAFTNTDEIHWLLGALGGYQSNAATRHNTTSYHGQIPAHQVKNWLKLYGEIFTQPVFRQFQEEAQIVMEEYAMYESEYDAFFEKEFYQSILQGLKYSRMELTGDWASVFSITPQAMRQFFNTYYVPNNMAIILAGNITPDDAYRWAEAYFGHLKSREIPEIPSFAGKVLGRGEHIEVKRGKLNRSILLYDIPYKTHRDQALAHLARYLLYSESPYAILRNKEYAEVIPKGEQAVFFSGVAFAHPKGLPKHPKTLHTTLIESFADLTEEGFDLAKRDLISPQSCSGKSLQICVDLMEDAFQQGLSPQQMGDLRLVLQSISLEEFLQFILSYFQSPIKYVTFREGKNTSATAHVYGSTNRKATQKLSPAGQQFIENLEVPLPSKARHSVEKIEIKPGVSLFYHRREGTPDYSFTIRFPKGIFHDKRLEVLAFHWDNNLENSDVAPSSKWEIGVVSDFLEISLQGDYTDFLYELNRLSKAMVLDQKSLNSYTLGKNQFYHKTEVSREEEVIHLASEFLLYGANSYYLIRPSISDFNAYTQEEVYAAWSQLYAGPVEISYTGTIPKDRMVELLQQKFHFEPGSPQNIPTLTLKHYATPKVVVVDVKEAQSAKVVVYKPSSLPGSAHNPAVWSMLENYLNSKLFSWVRSQNALSYDLNAQVKIDNEPHVVVEGTCQPQNLEGFLSRILEGLTNGSVSADLFKVYQLQLVNNQGAYLPFDHNLTLVIAEWDRHNWGLHPYIKWSEEVRNFTFEDFRAFHHSVLFNTEPWVIMVVADKKKLDLEALKIFGAVEIIHPTSIQTR